jgi:hypothetical protein
MGTPDAMHLELCRVSPFDSYIGRLEGIYRSAVDRLQLSLKLADTALLLDNISTSSTSQGFAYEDKT